MPRGVRSSEAFGGALKTRHEDTVGRHVDTRWDGYYCRQRAGGTIGASAERPAAGCEVVPLGYATRANALVYRGGSCGSCDHCRNLMMSIRSMIRGRCSLGAQDGRVIEVASHRELGVALEQGERRVDVGPKLLFHLHLEDLKGFHKGTEMEGHPMVTAKKHIQEGAIALVVPLQGDERTGHLGGGGNNFAELVQGRGNVPPMEQTIHHSTLASLCGCLGGSSDKQEEGETRRDVVDIRGARLEGIDALKQLRGDDRVRHGRSRPRGPVLQAIVNRDNRLLLLDVGKNLPDGRQGCLGRGLTEHLDLDGRLGVHTEKSFGARSA